MKNINTYECQKCKQYFTLDQLTAYINAGYLCPVCHKQKKVSKKIFDKTFKYGLVMTILFVLIWISLIAQVTLHESSHRRHCEIFGDGKSTTTIDWLLLKGYTTSCHVDDKYISDYKLATANLESQYSDVALIYVLFFVTLVIILMCYVNELDRIIDEQ